MDAAGNGSNSEHSNAFSETSEAVKALEIAYSDLEPADTSADTTLKLEVGITEVSCADNIDSQQTDASIIEASSKPIFSSLNLINFDENAQYKVCGSNDDDLRESKSLEFTSDVPMYSKEYLDSSVKSSESSEAIVFIPTPQTNTELNGDSAEESILKVTRLASVSSSIIPIDERSDISENSLMTFPEGIALESGECSSDGDFLNKNETLDTTLRLEDSNDMAMDYDTVTESATEISTSNIAEDQPTLPQMEPLQSNLYTMPADNLFEYQWPQESGAEWYMLQEQISEFLLIKSFKRKYPDLKRRIPGQEEKEFLKARGVISETQCDLGLMALKADEVHDLMMKDYPCKYDEYAKVLHEKEKQHLKEKLKSYGAPKMDKPKYEAYVKKAVKSASEFNSQFQRERREDRKAYFDLQTMLIHYPANKRYVLPPELTKPSPYPVSLVPGQFQDYYKRYTPDELRYLPLNSALYGPPKVFTSHDIAPTDPPIEEEISDDEEPSNEIPTQTIEEPTIEECPVTKDEPDAPEVVIAENETRCRVCSSLSKITNGSKISEQLVMCSECKAHGHPSCLDLTAEMVEIIKTYPWQCMDCKTCVECTDPYDEDKMMFCDRCDRGYHTFCVGLKGLPTGRWECPTCSTSQTQPKIKKPRKTRSDKGIKKGPLLKRQQMKEGLTPQKSAKPSS